MRGVVVFPGWFVEQRGPRGNVWVLEPKALPAFIENAPAMIAPSDVELAAYHFQFEVPQVVVLLNIFAFCPPREDFMVGKVLEQQLARWQLGRLTTAATIDVKSKLPRFARLRHRRCLLPWLG